MKKLRGVIETIGPSIAYVPLTRGMYALIDADDAPRVAEINWHTSGGQMVYALGTIRAKEKGGVGTDVYLHRFLCTATSERPQVDHRNGQTLDCRKSNLRTATHAENMRNSRIPKDNKTGFKGVWQKPSGRYQAEIRVNYRKINLGLYDTPELAAAAYRDAAALYHSEFARAA